MKIKHWQGYGCVNAKKIESCNGHLKIRVWGNHEWGLERDDKYDVFNWLVKKFSRKYKDYRDISDIILSDRYEKIDGILTEVCDYDIWFDKGRFLI